MVNQVCVPTQERGNEERGNPASIPYQFWINLGIDINIESMSKGGIPYGHPKSNK